LRARGQVLEMPLSLQRSYARQQWRHIWYKTEIKTVSKQFYFRSVSTVWTVYVAWRDIQVQACEFHIIRFLLWLRYTQCCGQLLLKPFIWTSIVFWQQCLPITCNYENYTVARRSPLCRTKRTEIYCLCQSIVSRFDETDVERWRRGADFANSGPPPNLSCQHGRPWRNPPPLFPPSLSPTSAAWPSSWRRDSVVRTSVCSWRTFPDLRLIHGWRVTTLWVRRLLWVNQLGQLSLPSFRGL